MAVWVTIVTFFSRRYSFIVAGIKISCGGRFELLSSQHLSLEDADFWLICRSDGSK